MSKKGVSVVSGNTSPKIGEKSVYKIAGWYPDTPAQSKDLSKVTWELFKKRRNGSFTTTNIKKVGDSSFTFGVAAENTTYRLEAYLYEPEGGGLIIKPQPGAIPKINNVVLNYVDDTPGTTFSFMEKLRAKANCTNMERQEVIFTLWEDDAAGEKHNSKNLPIDTQKGRVGKNGQAVVDFLLTKALMQKAMKGETDTAQLEFYVTAEYYRVKREDSNNVHINNPLEVKDTKPAKSKSTIPKAKNSPAIKKAASKKEVKGIFDQYTGFKKELWDWSESKGSAKKDKLPTVQKPDNKTTTKVGAADKIEEKEKFDKVNDKAEEAVIYISSEIATAIVVDKNGKLVSYPDLGGYNGQEEYKVDGKIYCKKIITGKYSGKSAFPTYKAYIYRGNVHGEALKKLKQDLEHKTHENSERIILELARHTLSNNKNYLKGGPTPPNTINKLYRLSYKTAKNTKGKVSYRYRIVDDNNTNFPKIKDFKKEYENGTMTLGVRGSISIDPWNSNGLIGCVGVRGEKGTNLSSTKDTYSKQDKANYKYIYHSINNYLEEVIPELTGIYGRRGFSASEGTVKVSLSTYDHETKVYVLIDELPEIDNCTCKLKKDGRETFYKDFGESAIKMVESKNKSNKFKGLYMIAQRRQENGFKLQVPNNNPMNIKDGGDLGKADLFTREVIKGKEIFINDGFGKFSTIEKGFEGYLKLLERNFNDAYNAILDNSKSIDDFLTGMQDNGKNGAYATDPNYKTSIKDIFNGVVKDYEMILDCKLCKAKKDEDKDKIKKDIKLLKELK